LPRRERPRLGQGGERRSAQFALKRAAGAIGWPDVEVAINELPVRGGALNRMLLGNNHSHWEESGGEGAA